VSLSEEEELDLEGRMTLMEHLTELRSRLIKSVLAIVFGTVIVWMLYPQIYDILVHPLCEVEPDSCELYLRDPLEGFSIRLRVSGYGGIALAMPVILWQLWRFITPGLYPHEKKYAIPFVTSALALFILGASLAYFTLARALQFLIDIAGADVGIIFSPEPYIKLITYMMLAFGIGFEFPIVLVFMQLVGVLQPSTLVRYRRYALIGILVTVAVITPSGDPYSMLLLSVPMYLFYEISIVIGKLIVRRRRKREAELAV
jgi:sec-independent protein translocase protein TatC